METDFLYYNSGCQIVNENLSIAIRALIKSLSISFIKIRAAVKSHPNYNLSNV